MPKRVNRAIELLEQDQPVYYTGSHTAANLTYEAGKEMAKTWADYINIGMEHGPLDLVGLANYMRGLVDGGTDQQRSRDAGGRRRVADWTVPVPMLCERMRGSSGSYWR